MGRRKTIFYGRRLDEKFRVALEFPDHQHSSDILSEIDYEIPKIDWHNIEGMVGREVPEYAKQEIDFFFEAELGSRIRSAITSDLSGDDFGIEMYESDFLKTSDRVENLARKLTEEINELAELGCQLLVRPLPKDGLTSAEEPDQFYAKVTGQTFAPSDDCFIDYYSFRKVLDYYSTFSKQNGGFQSVLGSRFDRMPDYSWYETFVRRVVPSLWPTSFPMTVTIPTDSNPDFHSPIILVLEALRDEFNRIALTNMVFAEIFEKWTYRQHARLVLRLREEFEKSEIFWALASLRKYKSEQSDFPENIH